MTPVEQGALNRMEVLIAGISEVTNPQPAYKLSAPETDDALRRRARGALHGVVRGTVDALRFGLLSTPAVKEAAIVEAPNGVPGEIKIDVAYTEESEAVFETVRRRIDELRPAGVRVVVGKTAGKRLNVQVNLTLAGTGLPEAEIVALTQGIEARLADHLEAIPAGLELRLTKLTNTLVTEDELDEALKSRQTEPPPGAVDTLHEQLQESFQADFQDMHTDLLNETTTTLRQEFDQKFADTETSIGSSVQEELDRRVSDRLDPMTADVAALSQNIKGLNTQLNTLDGRLSELDRSMTEQVNQAVDAGFEGVSGRLREIAQEETAALAKALPDRIRQEFQTDFFQKIVDQRVDERLGRR